MFTSSSSLIKHTAQRAAIFIDTQNLYHSAKKLYQSRVNFNQVVKESVLDRQLVRAVAYLVTTESGDEQNFLGALENLGIETKTKELQVFLGGAKKADWDIGLAIDAIKMASKLDTVIIASGDGDFVPLVEYLKIKEGCRVEAISFGKSSSSKLIEAVDSFVDMDENPKNYLIGYKKQKGNKK